MMPLDIRPNTIHTDCIFNDNIADNRARLTYQCKNAIRNLMNTGKNRLISSYNVDKVSTLILDMVALRITETNTDSATKTKAFLEHYLQKTIKGIDINRECIVRELMIMFAPDDKEKIKNMAIELYNVMKKQYDRQTEPEIPEAYVVCKYTPKP